MASTVFNERPSLEIRLYDPRSPACRYSSDNTHADATPRIPDLSSAPPSRRQLVAADARQLTGIPATAPARAGRILGAAEDSLSFCVRAIGTCSGRERPCCTLRHSYLIGTLMHPESAHPPPDSVKTPRGHRTALTVVSIAALIALVGCASNDSLSQQYREGNEKGFIAGDFQVVEIPEAERGEPVAFEGVTETDERVSSDDYRGEVLVVNFWYAACGPCIVEAPYLEQVWQDYQDEGVAVLGVNTYDQAATALSFAKDNGVTYPSVIDVNDGTVKLAFVQVTPIQATPTTLVLDRGGRVAARVIGQLDSASILATLVDDVLEESAP